VSEVVTKVTGAWPEPDEQTITKTAENLLQVKDSGITYPKLKTAFGSYSGTVPGNGGEVDVTMNKYTFFPSITSTSGGGAKVTQYLGAEADGTAKCEFRQDATADVELVLGWDYITASDLPDVHVVFDGKFWHVRVSEVPNGYKDDELITVKLPSGIEFKAVKLKLSRTDKEDLFSEVKPHAVEILKVLEKHEIIREKVLSLKDAFIRTVA